MNPSSCPMDHLRTPLPSAKIKKHYLKLPSQLVVYEDLNSRFDITASHVTGPTFLSSVPAYTPKVSLMT